MKKTRHLLFFRVLALILFLGIGQISLASSDSSLESVVEVPGEIQPDHRLKYEGQYSYHDMVMAEGNYQIPSVKELRPNFIPFFTNQVYSFNVDNGKEFLFLEGHVLFTPSLDGLTMIFPFHTFL